MPRTQLFMQQRPYEEEVLWNYIKSTNYYWSYYKVNVKSPDEKALGEHPVRVFDVDGPAWDRLEHHWQLLSSGDFDGIAKLAQESGEDLSIGKSIKKPDEALDFLTLVKFPGCQDDVNIGI